MRGKFTLVLLALTMISCSKDWTRTDQNLDYHYGRKIPHGKIVLGDRLENPYTTENITKALYSLYPTKADRVDVNATPLAAYIMCECIAKYYAATGKKIGFKPAGGISSAADALCYYSIVASLLGKEWLNKELFRFGVSRVANSILSAVEQKTVSYF